MQVVYEVFEREKKSPLPHHYVRCFDLRSR